MIALEPIWQGPAQQAIFRAVLRATSYPGTVVDLSEMLAGRPAEVGILAALLDATTTFHDADDRIGPADLGMLDRIEADLPDAAFALFDASRPPADGIAPRLGTLERPDLGATLVLACRAVGDGPMALALAGPGIESETTLRLGGVHRAWLDRREAWVAGFPTGVDLLLCDDRRVAALPRTTSVTIRST